MIFAYMLVCTDQSVSYNFLFACLVEFQFPNVLIGWALIGNSVHIHAYNHVPASSIYDLAFRPDGEQLIATAGSKILVGDKGSQVKHGVLLPLPCRCTMLVMAAWCRRSEATRRTSTVCPTPETVRHSQTFPITRHSTYIHMHSLHLYHSPFQCYLLRIILVL